MGTNRLREWFKGDGGVRGLRIASYVVIGIGVVLLLVAGVNLGYRQWERRQLRVSLSSTPPLPTLAIKRTPQSTPESPEPTATRPTSQAISSADSPLPTPAATAAVEAPTAVPSPTPTSTPAAAPPVRLVISDLQIDAQVVEMAWKIQDVGGIRTSVWDLDDIGNGLAGHLVSSGLPGLPGNVVIAGHHNIEGQVFRNVSDAWDDAAAEVIVEGLSWRSDALSGRSIVLYDADGREHTYVIDAMYKLKDRDVPDAQRVENGRFMEPTIEPVLTLVTCWPANNNTHRIVVVAKLLAGES